MTPVPDTFVTRSETETRELASRLAADLRPGAVILLFGGLGAGKTAFVRGLAEGLDAEPEQVSSPTFVLIQEYRGRATLYHVDLYRVEGLEVEGLGLEELGTDGGIVAIEWADRLRRPVEGALDVRIADRGGDEREITIDWSAYASNHSTR